MIIDAHIHVGSWTHADFLGRQTTLDETLAMLAKSGIVGAALTESDKCEHDLLRDAMKRAIAAGRTEQMWLFPWIRIDEAGAQDLAWTRKHIGDVTGLKIHPSLSRKRITDDAFKPALELAAERNLVVLLHCGRWQEIAGYAHALDAAQAWPTVRWLFAHAGGDTPPNATNAALGVAERGLENVWFEFSGLREYWVVERNVAKIGAGRYLMGSDWPLAHPKMYLGAIDGMELPEADKRKILGENAAMLFGRPMSA